MSEMQSVGEEVLKREADSEPPRVDSLDDFELLAMEDSPTLSDDSKLVDVEEAPAFPSTDSSAEPLVPVMEPHVEGVTDSKPRSPPSIAHPESAMAADDPAFPRTNSPPELVVPTMQSHATKSKSHSAPSTELPETPTAAGPVNPKQDPGMPSPPKRPRLSSLSSDDAELEKASDVSAVEPDSSRVASVPTPIEPTAASTSSAVRRLRTLRVSGLPPKGLTNFGNSCYLNSVVQCLTYIPLFARICKSLRHSNSCSVGIKKGCFLCIMEDRVETNLCQKSKLGNPRRLYDVVVGSNQFAKYEQADAHELLGFLISKSTDAYKLEHSRFNASYLERLFTGKTRTSTTCCQCGEVSIRDENTLCHSLSITGVVGLAGAFAQECAKELLDGDNKYRCERCNDLMHAKRQTWIHEQPQVLSIQLKRFDESLQKISHHVEFPEQLSLADYMESTANPVFHYKLCGVVTHYGQKQSTSFGHYFAFVKETNEKWYLCNDEEVTKVSKEHVLKTNAYLLFYKKESSSIST